MAQLGAHFKHKPGICDGLGVGLGVRAITSNVETSREEEFCLLGRVLGCLPEETDPESVHETQAHFTNVTTEKEVDRKPEAIALWNMMLQPPLLCIRVSQHPHPHGPQILANTVACMGFHFPSIELTGDLAGCRILHMIHLAQCLTSTKSRTN